MKRVGFDERCGALTIMGGESYFPHSLMAEADGEGMIRVTSCADRVELYVPWTEIADLAGNGFFDAAAALAYLQGEFAKRLSGLPGPSGPGIFSGAGDPDPGLGQAGDLYIDAVSGDLYQKGA